MKYIGIVGNGYVGQATSLLRSRNVSEFIYDIDPDKCSHAALQLADLVESCSFIFVCVPTPMNHDGSCSTFAVDKVVIELLDLGYEPERIIVKSTVPVGTCRKLDVMFMPEFLTERNWTQDFLDQKNWILGTNKRDDKITDDLYSIFSQAWSTGQLKNKPNISFSTTEEAELIKYVRNCFLATKVSFFNEIHSFCSAKDINYEKVAELTCLDERISDSHTQVPGPDGKRGFGGTCFPKDMESLSYQLSNAGVAPKVIKSCILRNERIDRPEKDWEKSKGRAVV